MSTDEATGALAEFAALRDETVSRLKISAQLFMIQLTVTGGIFGFAITRSALTGLLLILPATSYLICARFTAQETRMQLIGLYIRDNLSHRVSGGLQWEEWWRKNRVDTHRWTVPVVLLYPGSGLLALVWFAVSALSSQHLSGNAAGSAGFIVAWIIGVALTAASLFVVIATARKINPRLKGGTGIDETDPATGYEPG